MTEKKCDQKKDIRDTKKTIYVYMDKKIVSNTLTHMLIYNISEVILETCVEVVTTFLTA